MYKIYQEWTYWFIRREAKAFAIGYKTLYRRIHRGQTCNMAHAYQQILTISEEKAILKWTGEAKIGCNAKSLYVVLL